MPRFEPLDSPLLRVTPGPLVMNTSSRAGAARVRLPFVRHVPLAGWGPFLRFGARTAEVEDRERPLHTRALVLEAERGGRVALVTIDLHGGSRYITEKAASLLGDTGIHVGNLFLCGTHNHAGPGGLYASPYFDAFAASTGIFSTRSKRVGFNQTLADVLAERVAQAVKEAVAGLREARVGSSHDVRLRRWSRQRSQEAVKLNFPSGTPEAEMIERFHAIGGGEAGDGLERWALDARVQTIAAFDTDDRLIGSFSSFGAHNAILSREHEVQSADYFGEAASRAETHHAGSVIAIAAGSIGDADPLPPGLSLEGLLARRANPPQNLELISEQAKALATGVMQAIGEAARRPVLLRSLSARYLEDQIAGAEVEEVKLPLLPQIGIPTLAGSELGTGDIRVGIMFHMREGVRRPDPDLPKDPHWPRSRTNWDDSEANWFQRAAGAFGAWLAFKTTTPFLEQQHKRLPIRYLALELGDRKVSVLGLPGEPTTWLAAQLAALCTGDSIVTGVTGDYVGYLTTGAEYASQQYEGGSTIWGRHTERWLKSQVRKLVGGAGATPPAAGPAEFTVLRESWTTRIDGERGVMTRR